MSDSEWVLIDEWSEPEPLLRPPEADDVRRLAIRRRIRDQGIGDPDLVADAEIRIDTVICCGSQPIDRCFRLWLRRSALDASAAR